MTAAPPIRLNGATLQADPSGALYWPAMRTLVVADLHLEKGSAFARRGQLLPPYDTAATLTSLTAAIGRYRPERVVALGDSFHDGEAAERLSLPDRARLRSLTTGRDWVWICGNHDPAPPKTWGGRVEPELTLGPLSFRHEASPARRAGEVSGHFHPKAAVRLRLGRFTARCFIVDRRRLILPAFGAYTGGLDVLDPAIASLFEKSFAVHLIGRDGIYVFPKTALVPI